MSEREHYTPTVNTVGLIFTWHVCFQRVGAKKSGIDGRPILAFPAFQPQATCVSPAASPGLPSRLEPQSDFTELTIALAARLGVPLRAKGYWAHLKSRSRNARDGCAYTAGPATLASGDEMAAAQQIGTVPASAPPDALADAHAQVLSDRGLQFEMASIEPPEIPPWLEPLLEALSAIAPFMIYVFWGGVILAVLFFLYIIGSEIARRLPDRTQAKDDAASTRPEYRPAQAHARALLEEADRLAKEGRFSEAARVLLHRSIEDIETVFSLAIGPGLTSREIAQLGPLSSQGRDVFGRIAHAVETSLFGGRPLSANDFMRCREAYASFALSGPQR